MRIALRNGGMQLAVFLVNSLLTYCIIQTLVPTALVRLEQGWHSGKRLQSAGSRRSGARASSSATANNHAVSGGGGRSGLGTPAGQYGTGNARRRRGDDDSALPAAIDMGAVEEVVEKVMQELPQSQQQRQPDSLPLSLASRNRLHVPMVHFQMVGMAPAEQNPNAVQPAPAVAAAADDETRPQIVRADAAAMTRGGAAAMTSSVGGGAFDYAGRPGKYWARAFYFDEHTLGAVLLRPPRAQRRQVCKYQGVNANAMEFKGSMGESHGAPVDKLTVICRFGDAIKRPADGDLVELWDDTDVPIFAYDIAKPFTWTVCTPPLLGNIRHDWLAQVVRYYVRKLSAEYFFFYSGVPMTTPELTRLGVDMADRFASVIDISSQAEFKPYFFAQTTAIHDCLYLNRQLRTEWVLYQDMDEVLVLGEAWPDPMAFFDANKEKSAITFGMWSVDSRVCRPESEVEPDEEEWPLLARMQKKTRGPYCGNLCIDWRGRRKYALQPGRVDALFIHKPIARSLLNLPVSQAFLRNYWRAQNNDLAVCGQIDSSPKKP